MSWASVSVKHGITTLMLYIVAVGFGLFSLSRIGLDMYPDITLPLAGIITTYEGTSPEDMEQLVTRTIEEAAASVKGVSRITSTSKQGASVVLVEFEWGYDVDKGELDLRKALDFVRDYLPPDAKSPLTFVFNPSMQPIMFLFLSGNYDQAQLRRVADHDISPRLERLEGVAAVDIMGGLQREIQVRVLPERLRAYQISVQQVVQVLRTENLQIPAGNFEQGGQEFVILSEGRFQNVDEIRGLVVGYKQAGMVDTPLGPQPTPAARMVPVYLRDVADVQDTFHEPTRVVRANGQSAVFLSVRKQSGFNTVRASQAVREALPDIQRSFPNVKFSIYFDQSEFINLSLGNLTTTGYQALAFTFGVLLLFLASIRGSLVVTLSIPISIIATFAVMDQLGLTLNILSMTGLALAIGMLVDNSIVVLENIQRHVENGMEPAAAAIKGAGEVTMAVTASTLTTIAVFAPIPFIPGIAGLLVRDMAWTIIVSLMASLLVAVTLVPLLASWFLARDSELSRKLWYRRWILHAIDVVRDGYAWALVRVLRWRKTSVLVTVALFAVTMWFGMRGLGFDFFPNMDQGMSQATVTAAVGTSLERTDELFKRVEGIASEIPEVQFVTSDIGTGESFTAIFSKGSYAGTLRIKYTPLRERTRYQTAIEKDLVERLRVVPGLEVSTAHPSITGSGGDIDVEIYGEDLDLARTVGLEVKKILQGIEGISEVTFSLEQGKPEYRVRLDRERMAVLGVSALAVTNTIQAYFQGVVATMYREAGYDYNVLVRAPKDRRLDVRELTQMPVATMGGKQVPLSEVAKIEPSVGPVEVQRKNQQRMVVLSATVPGSNLGGVVDKVEAAIQKYTLPPEFTYHVGGTAEDLRDTQRYMTIAFLVAVLLVYMVMASQFESLLEPFIIFFTMPMGAMGVALTFWITGITLSVPAIIGIVILVGVVVNNGIVLVDRANQSHRDEGKPLFESVVEAGRLRFRPVLMTALTTILGMAPLAAEIGEGAETWSPMAKTLIGGLSAATFLTLFIVPALYVMIVGFVERMREHGMLRLLPAYLGFWAFSFAAAAAGAVVFSSQPTAPPELAEKLPLIVGSAAAFAALCVVAAVGIYKRKVWGWWTGFVPWLLLCLAGAAVAAGAVYQNGVGPKGLPGVGGGAAIVLVAVVVLRPLWRRRKEFGASKADPTPPAPPPGSEADAPSQ
jgi:HAE1 family hydrophobic/amphiphilic exporter-1